LIVFGKKFRNMKAIWKGEVIAQSDETKVVESNHYFPPESVKKGMLKETQYTKTCPWRGIARYYDIHAGGEVNEAAAYSFPDPKLEAIYIKDYFAFCKGVKVEE
jgi:uncharacterized protein (DUF427 family)